jgi:hypothetical protein
MRFEPAADSSVELAAPFPLSKEIVKFGATVALVFAAPASKLEVEPRRDRSPDPR